MRYPKIIDELNDSMITVVQLVSTISNPIDFIKYYDTIGTVLYFSFIGDDKSEFIGGEKGDFCK